MHHQPIFDIAELCGKKGVDTAVLCPGSRCAPLTLAFSRNPKITCRTFTDERSAGFIGLGLAQQQKRPVVLICTSGSAAYNFAPAVAEAFFSETPVIIFTADRPAEWVAQHDGQTIFQSEIFGKHVKHSYQLPQDYDHADSIWAMNRIVNEAINLSKQYPQGPVHINAPFREPLYPGKDETTGYSEDVRVIDTHGASPILSDEEKSFINKEWIKHHKILIVAAQGELDSELVSKVTAFAESRQIPLVADIISNFNGSLYPVRHSDLFLGQASDHLKKSLHPDLLITFGKSLISKNLKLFLRKYSPKKHWHLQTAGIAADTFKNLTDVFPVNPSQFFEHLSTVPTAESFESQKQKNYCKLWEVEERRALRVLKQYFPLEQVTELEVVKDVLQLLPENSNLHLSNSMSVRYANFIGIGAEGPNKNIEVFANRGTSGIDGSSSTSVGHALADPKKMNVLITGDLAFFYDRNAFWHNYELPNLRILLLNNHGGLIFNMIDGPASQPEASEYFITKQKLNALKLCEEFGFEYLRLDNKRKVKNLLRDFFDPEARTKILEVETDLQLNRTTFDNLKQKIKESYES
jgi:2-succinyl-5-enolpyruvyl-6-hydroxy-3-cyclohexene-1-carboxylate synthase